MCFMISFKEYFIHDDIVHLSVQIIADSETLEKKSQKKSIISELYIQVVIFKSENQIFR